MQLLDHPYAKFLDKVEKPNRYTGAEHGTRRKPWDIVQARVCLAFPEIYDIGMSHLGYRILYKILNDDTRTLAERAYLPWSDMQRQLQANGKLLVSLESSRPLCDFDMVGFSLQYELTYTNVLTMLELSGIPLRSAARSDADPLIVAGGPVATHCEPIADFIDAILIGDGEEAATEIALCWTEGKRLGLSRRERLLRLAMLRGVYVPSLYETAIDPVDGFMIVTGPKEPGLPFPIERRLLEDISQFPFPDDGPVGGPEAIFDRMSIEVARGCTEGCRFLPSGHDLSPGARAKSGRGDRHGRARARKVGTRRSQPDRAFDGGRELHLALDQEIRSRRRRPSASAWASRRCAPTAWPKTCSTTCARCARRV